MCCGSCRHGWCQFDPCSLAPEYRPRLVWLKQSSGSTNDRQDKADVFAKTPPVEAVRWQCVQVLRLTRVRNRMVWSWCFGISATRRIATGALHRIARGAPLSTTRIVLADCFVIPMWCETQVRMLRRAERGLYFSCTFKSGPQG